MDSDTKNLEKAMKALQTDEQIEDYLCCQQEDGEIKYFYEETNKALEIGGYCRLNPKDERDVRIAVAINTRKHDVVKINESLIKNDLQPLKI